MLSSGNKEYVNNLIQSFEPKEILVSKENKKKYPVFKTISNFNIKFLTKKLNQMTCKN